MKLRLIAAAAVTALIAVPVASGAATKAKTKTVKIADDYYGPSKLTVAKGTKVKWVWQADNANSHDVKLSKGPKGAKKFHSDSASADFSFSQTLSKPGTYKIICTLHSDMDMTITVRK